MSALRVTARLLLFDLPVSRQRREGRARGEEGEMTITAAAFRAGAWHLLRRSRPALANQWSVTIYSIDGGAESREVMNDFPSTLAAVKAFRENAARHILYVLVPVHATTAERDKLWENGATLCI
jgi:hypothetical protein